MAKIVDEMEIEKSKEIKTEYKFNERVGHGRGNKDYITDHTNTECCLCNNKRTKILSNGRPFWLKYKIDKNNNFSREGNWDEKSYICNLCYYKERRKLPDSYTNKIKSQRQFRNKELSRNSSSGKGFIGQQIWCKVRGVKDCNIEMDNFNYKYDHTIDKEYGIVNTKTSSFHIKYNSWNFSPSGKYDNIVLMCMSTNWKNVERTYIIPIKEIEKMINISISKNSTSESWYEKYRVNNNPYNEAYQSMNLENCPVLKSNEEFNPNIIQRPKKDVTERFMSHVNKDNSNGCHIWSGALNINCYGNFYYNEKYVSAHVAAYEIFKEKVPEGKEIHHLCKNRNCVNPEHLIAETHTENMNRLKGSIRVDHIDTVCYLCNSDKTRTQTNGRPLWLRYLSNINGNFDFNGEWNGKYICNKCYDNEKYRVDEKMYNKAYHQLDLKNCPILIDEPLKLLNPGKPIMTGPKEFIQFKKKIFKITKSSNNRR